MNYGNLGKGALTVPALAAGVDMVTKSPLGETIEQTIGTVDAALNVGNSMLNPLFANVAGGVTAATIAGGASAALLTNSVLGDLGVEKKWLKYGLSGVAGVAGYTAGTVAAPYLVAGGLSYAILKHGWKWGKELAKRGLGTVWGATGGLVKGAAKGAVKGAYEGIKGNQKINPVI